MLVPQQLKCQETCLQKLQKGHTIHPNSEPMCLTNLVYKLTPADNSDGATLDSSPLQGRCMKLQVAADFCQEKTLPCNSAKALEYRFFFTIDVHS